MDRFRKNDVKFLATKEVILERVTVCERCVITTTDQKTGERPKSDLLRVLGGTRRRPKSERYASGIVFGAYMAVRREGVLRVGDEVSVEI